MEHAWNRPSFGVIISLHDYLLDLLNNLIDPDLNFFFFLDMCFLYIKLLTSAPLLVTNIQLALHPPSIPFINKPFAISDELGTVKAVFCRIFFIKCAAIFPKIFPD